MSGSLQFLESDTSLACVRDADALERLPATEREAFRKLWADVHAWLVQLQPPDAER